MCVTFYIIYSWQTYFNDGITKSIIAQIFLVVIAKAFSSNISATCIGREKYGDIRFLVEIIHLDRRDGQSRKPNEKQEDENGDIKKPNAERRRRIRNFRGCLF